MGKKKKDSEKDGKIDGDKYKWIIKKERKVRQWLKNLR